MQEGLTNAIRYAAGATATVRLCHSGTGILIEVADEGRAGPGGPSDRSILAGEGGGADLVDAACRGASAGPGGVAGLAGLRERARLLGGQFEAGRCQRGFVVRAFLPSPA